MKIRNVKYGLLLTLSVMSATVFAQQTVTLDSLWHKDFKSAKDIVATYEKGKAYKSQRMDNTCYLIWNSGEYIIKNRGKVTDMGVVAKHVTPISLDHAKVRAFMKNHDAATFTDHYFMLSALKRGDAFEEARDGVTATVFFPIRPLNKNDYDKLRVVFSSKNKELHEAYMKKLFFVFDLSGCNDELMSLYPLIKKNCADSKTKTELLNCYSQYQSVMSGHPAPISDLKDAQGKVHTFAEFRGKVLVIDVWATWCCSCLENIPKFHELKNEFKNNKDVEFISVSIDRSKKKQKWLQTIEKYHMGDMLNLIPDLNETSKFESDFHVTGVPRYIILDKQGNIVTAYAPTPGKEMKEIIINTLNKSK